MNSRTGPGNHALSITARKRTESKVLLLSVSLSVAIHAIIFVFRVDLPAAVIEIPAEAWSIEVAPVFAMRVVVLAPVEPDVSTPVIRVEPPNPLSPPAQPRPLPEGTSLEPPVDRPRARHDVPRSASDVLRPRAGASSLRIPAADIPRTRVAPFRSSQPTLGELLRRMSDSVAAAEKARSQFTSWTRRGRNWELAPGRIRFGPVTIPMCYGGFDAADCGFGVSSGRRDEYRARSQADREIRQQTQRMDLRRTLEAGARRMRARRDARRDSIRRGGR